MKREEVIKRLGYTVPRQKRVRVLVHSDAKNEADDQYAILHHLLTPAFDVRGIIAAHFEGRFTNARKFSWEMTEAQKRAYFRGERRSMEASFQEVKKILELAGIDDVPAVRGCERALYHETEVLDSDGMQLIIEECMRQDERPLFLAMQGGLTDLASALNKCPQIAERMTVIWIGGGPYPEGGIEFNIMQDVAAARRVFASRVKLWQIPSSVYQEVEVSIAALAAAVRPCGQVGAYLFQELLDVNEYLAQFEDTIRKGENWCLGDSPTVGVLLQNGERCHYHIRKAPEIREDMTYKYDPDGKEIRVYDSIDARLLLDDFFAKIKLCYGGDI